jgi:hypothetical protein
MKSTKTKKTSTRSSLKATKNKTATKSITIRGASRNDAGSTMPLELKRVVARLKDKKQQLGLGWKRDALLTYEIGAEVAKVMRDRSTYGSKAVETLAEELKLDKATLYRWASVATTWSKAAFAKLAARRSTKSDLPLTWSHYELLAEEKDSKRCEKMLDRALDEALTVAALRDLLKGGAKKSSGRTIPVATAPAKPNVWNWAHDLVEEQTEMVKALASIAAQPNTVEHAELMKELYASCEKLMAAIKPIVTTAIAASTEAPAKRMVQ